MSKSSTQTQEVTVISESTQNVLDYLGSFDMFKEPAQPVVSHVVSVEFVKNNHGYPFQAQCECGWKSNTYVARHAAQSLGDEHAA